MDLVAFIKTVRRVEMIINSHLTQRQKMLEFFQHSNVIRTDSSSEEEEENKVPNNFSKTSSLITKLASSNYKHIDSIKNSYTSEDLEDKDVKLFEGVIKRSKNESSKLIDPIIEKFKLMRNHSSIENEEPFSRPSTISVTFGAAPSQFRSISSPFPKTFIPEESKEYEDPIRLNS